MKAKVILLLAVFVLCFTSLAISDDFQVGDQVVLKPTKAIGVPLHREPKASMFGRGEEGLTAQIVNKASQGRWIRLKLEDGRLAWVLSKYIQKTPGTTEPVPSVPSTIMAQVFQSESSCNTIQSSGGNKTLLKAKEALRIATWNIRWFPQGTSSDSGTKKTNLEWLSCIMAWLDADIIAVQEIVNTRETESAWDSLSDSLTARTGDDWNINLQNCGTNSSQHVGFIWNSSRVKLSDFQDQWLMNGAATSEDKPCAGSLRPGLSAYAKAVNDGADFHIVAVHLDSGRSKKDYQHRKVAISRIGDLYNTLQAVKQDDDVIVLGDKNTMGHKEDGGLSSQKEIKDMSELLENSSPQFKLIAPDLSCSEYYDGKCTLLDHYIISFKMASDGEAKDSSAKGYWIL